MLPSLRKMNPGWSLDLEATASTLHVSSTFPSPEIIIHNYDK